MLLANGNQELTTPIANVRKRRRSSLNLCDAWNTANARHVCESKNCNHEAHDYAHKVEEPSVANNNESLQILPAGSPNGASTNRSNMSDDAPRDMHSDEDISDDGLDDPMITKHPVVNYQIIQDEAVESDLEFLAAMDLSKYMREQPCVPLNKEGNSSSQSDIDEGHQLSLYSCPFVSKTKQCCTFECNDRAEFLHHVCAGVSDPTHEDLYVPLSSTKNEHLDRFTVFSEAMAIVERAKWPLLGLSVTRRALNQLCLRFSDDNIKCLVCFMCAEQRTTCSGYAEVDLTAPLKKDRNSTSSGKSEIRFVTREWFLDLESKCPGAVLNLSLIHI